MFKLPLSYKDPKILNNQYIVKNQLASGSFGIVFLGFDKSTKDEFAIKLEKEQNRDVGTLDREVHLLSRLQGINGIPKLQWSGFEQNYNVMVLELLGRDLASLLKQYRKFTLKTGLQLLEQLIYIMEQVHTRGIQHRDLKPENIMMGRAPNENKVYLVDFGVSKIFIEKNKHIPFRQGKSFIGTCRYASIASHLGNEQGRKDDLESLFYVIIYCLRGRLPWQNVQNFGHKDRSTSIGQAKIATDIGEICLGLPKEFVECLQYNKY